MQPRYNPKLKMSLPPLGFGVMRLPINSDGTFSVEVHSLLAEAYECGINYFDTAYNYLGGHSEELIRDAIVAHYPRSSFYIADKLPVWLCADKSDMERIFQIELERLGVDFIDFYLLHGLNRSTWADAYSNGVLDFIEQKKREGKIHKIGFSMHDDVQTLKLILDAYKWEFALLQINYYDWIALRAKENYDLLEERGIPCMVMEPVGGGRLAKLPDDAEKLMTTVRPNDSIASWALRFIANLPNVVVTLSGMSNSEQLLDNISVFSTPKPLSDTEQTVLNDVADILSNSNTIPCTYCRYCLEECPKDIAISHIFQIYNDCAMFEHARALNLEYNIIIPQSRRGGNCVECGKCADRCPQKIDIPQQLKMVHNTAVGLALGVDVGKLKENLPSESLVICFGAGEMGCNALAVLRECGCKIDYFCDNAEHLWGTEIDGVETISPSQLCKLHQSQKVQVLITSGYHDEIKAQLGEIGISTVS